MTGLPFTAVVGHDDVRRALLLAAVDPGLGGVLLTGEKGTAKTTLVRGLAALLPDVAVVAGCRFSCDPGDPDPACPDGPHPPDAPAGLRAARLVEVPLGVGDDRITGSLDVAQVLAGRRAADAFTPGLLAAAHRGILYVDEVNLLPDALVDLLLDAAAGGRVQVERDGISVQHAARFVLIGTMNPEEGELRPQLLDRFGLAVPVVASADPASRAAAVRTRLEHDADPAGSQVRHEVAERSTAAAVVAARAALATVALGDAPLLRITTACAALGVDGLRGDLVTCRAAMALAAWDGRQEVGAADIREAARLALPHRRRRGPFDAPTLAPEDLEAALGPDDPDPSGGQEPTGGQDVGGTDDGEGGDGDNGDGDRPGPDGPGGPPGPDPSGAGSGVPQSETGTTPPAGAGGQADEPGAPPAPASSAAGPAPTGRRLPTADAALPPLPLPAQPRRRHGAAGRRARGSVTSGRPVASLPDCRRPDLLPTLKAAAPHQRARGRQAGGLLLSRQDLRRSARDGRLANLIVVVVDTSGSMAARRRASTVAHAVRALLTDSYRRRDRVAVIAFGGLTATTVVSPTGSVEVAAQRLAQLRIGGRTPLAAGLVEAANLVVREQRRDTSRHPLVVVVTDGRTTDPASTVAQAGLALARTGAGMLVVDAEDGPVRLGLAGRLAERLGAACLALPSSNGPLAGAAAGGDLASAVRRRGVC